MPAERQPSIHTLHDRRVIRRREELERKEKEGRYIEQLCGKCKDRGERSKRLSDGGVEFDSEEEGEERGESMLPKRGRERV